MLARSDLEQEAAALAAEPYAPDAHADAYTLRTLLSDPTTAGMVFFSWTARRTFGGSPVPWGTPARLWLAILAAGAGVSVTGPLARLWRAELEILSPAFDHSGRRYVDGSARLDDLAVGLGVPIAALQRAVTAGARISRSPALVWSRSECAAPVAWRRRG